MGSCFTAPSKLWRYTDEKIMQILSSRYASQAVSCLNRGARFSKVPKSFLTRKAVVKSQTL